MSVLNNPFFNAIKNIREILDADQKKRSILMWLLLLINAIVDVVGLAAIFPLMQAALDEKLIKEDKYLNLLYNIIGVEDNIAFLFILSAILFVVFLIKNAISIFIFYIQARFSFNISKRISQKMFKYYYDQGFLFISNIDSGKKNYDMLTIPYYFGGSYLVETLIMSTELVVLVFILIALLIYNPIAVLFLIGFIVPVFSIVYLFTKNKTQKLGDERNLLYPKATSTILDSMNAYNDLILTNKEEYFFQNFTNIIDRINWIDAKQVGVYSKIHQRLNDIVLGLGLVVIFGFAYIFREKSTEIFSILSVFAIAGYRLLPAVNRIMASALTLKNVSYLISELKPLAGYKIKRFEVLTPMAINTNITFKNIGFSYPETDKFVLKDINFQIKKGETVGFIGSSGSGKTTLLHIFLRLIQESKGTVSIDGINLDLSNKGQFQKSIGYVQQNVYILNGSLKENIAFGMDSNEVDETQLIKAIQDAMLIEFVKQHPDGINMLLGENGVKLSGGQRQRVGIARALYKDAQILLFDEATSALDSETEKAIVTTIKNLTSLEKTIIIVAHRISTLEMCDRIFKLKEGHIVEEMSYAKLLKHHNI